MKMMMMVVEVVVVVASKEGLQLNVRSKSQWGPHTSIHTHSLDCFHLIKKNENTWGNPWIWEFFAQNVNISALSKQLSINITHIHMSHVLYYIARNYTQRLSTQVLQDLLQSSSEASEMKSRLLLQTDKANDKGGQIIQLIYGIAIEKKRCVERIQ